MSANKRKLDVITWDDFWVKCNKHRALELKIPYIMFFHQVRIEQGNFEIFHNYYILILIPRSEGVSEFDLYSLKSPPLVENALRN